MCIIVLKESSMCDKNNAMNQNKNSIHVANIRLGTNLDSNKILIRRYIFAKKETGRFTSQPKTNFTGLLFLNFTYLILF